MTDLSSRLHPVSPDGRARPAEPPPRERVEQLALELERGGYRIDPARVAEAILSGRRPPARRG
jgi:hypothetical protein